MAATGPGSQLRRAAYRCWTFLRGFQTLFMLTVGGMCLFALLGLGSWLYHRYFYLPELEREVLRRGELTELPRSATGVRTKVTSDLFFTGLDLSFVAPKADVDRWLSTSPGTRRTQPKSSKDGHARVFAIRSPAGRLTLVRVESDGRRVSVEGYTRQPDDPRFVCGGEWIDAEPCQASPGTRRP